jgi:hypothetical protein
MSHLPLSPFSRSSTGRVRWGTSPSPNRSSRTQTSLRPARRARLKHTRISLSSFTTATRGKRTRSSRTGNSTKRPAGRPTSSSRRGSSGGTALPRSPSTTRHRHTVFRGVSPRGGSRPRQCGGRRQADQVRTPEFRGKARLRARRVRRQDCRVPGGAAGSAPIVEAGEHRAPDLPHFRTAIGNTPRFPSPFAAGTGRRRAHRLYFGDDGKPEGGAPCAVQSPRRRDEHRRVAQVFGRPEDDVRPPDPSRQRHRRHAHDSAVRGRAVSSSTRSSTPTGSSNGSAYERVTVVSVVPTLLQFLLHARLDMEAYKLAHFRHVICGAGPLTVELAQKFEQSFKIPIMHGYGLSETTCYSCFLPIDLSRSEHREWMSAHGFPSIGVPLPVNEMAIHDDRGEREGGGGKGGDRHTGTQRDGRLFPG